MARRQADPQARQHLESSRRLATHHHLLHLRQRLLPRRERQDIRQGLHHGTLPQSPTRRVRRRPTPNRHPDLRPRHHRRPLRHHHQNDRRQTALGLPRRPLTMASHAQQHRHRLAHSRTPGIPLPRTDADRPPTTPQPLRHPHPPVLLRRIRRHHRDVRPQHRPHGMEQPRLPRRHHRTRLRKRRRNPQNTAEPNQQLQRRRRLPTPPPRLPQSNTNQSQNHIHRLVPSSPQHSRQLLTHHRAVPDQTHYFA